MDNPQKFSKVRVAVRIRPILPKEHTPSCVFISPSSPNELIIGQNRSFQFDKAFDSSSPQNQIYENCVVDLLSAFFSGYNATILAYGQTGSGKTYTMGSSNVFNVNEDDLGIIPRVIKSIFQEVEARSQKNECLLKVSFLEIYNEEILDLLDPKTGFSGRMLNRGKKQAPSSVTIREEKDGSIGLYGLIEEKVGSYEEMLACLERGSLSRSTSSTLMNETSSRSHAIFSITLEQHQIDDLYKTNKPEIAAVGGDGETPEFITAKFHFVDLAGSERIKKTGATGNTLKEGININKGLLCLGNVIAALTENSQHHIPYRDSKLTRILQDSLGGNARTFMIACVSPAESNYDETLNTLKYASRARNIKNKPKINTDPNTALVNQMKQQIFELKEEMLKYRMALKKHVGDQDFQSILMSTNTSTVGSGFEGVKEKMEDNAVFNDELKELRLKVARYEKDIMKLTAEKQVLRKELNSREMEFFSVKKERDLIRLSFERVQEEHNLPSIENKDYENTPKVKLLDEYNNTIAKLTRDLEDKAVFLKEIQGEYEKLLASSGRDQKLLLQKTEEIEILQKKLLECQNSSPAHELSKTSSHKEEKQEGFAFNFENKPSFELSEKNEGFTEQDPSETYPTEQSENEVKKNENFEELKAKEFLSVNKTTEKQLNLVDQTIRMKEELLLRMSEGQNYLEQSLIEEMKQQYHQKIQALQQEIRNLEKEKQNEQPNDVKKAPNKQKLQELESQIKDFKKKEKLQSGLARQVELQKNQLDNLAEEIKAIKKQKVQLMKKLKEDTENFEKWKNSQMKKLNDLTRKNQEKDEQILKLKKEFRNEKLEAKKALQIPMVKTEKSKSCYQRRSLRRKSSFLEENGINIRSLVVQNGLELVKKTSKVDIEVRRLLQEISSLESEHSEMVRKIANITLEFERLELEKASSPSFLTDYEEQMNFQTREEDLMSEKRDYGQTLDSLEEKIKFKKRKLEETKGKSPKNIELFIEEMFKKNAAGTTNISNEQFKDVIRAFYENIADLYIESFENAERADQANGELGEMKKNFEALDQKFKVSQAQYEFNLTKITSEYEERCLFLIKQQNEQMMSSVEDGKQRKEIDIFEEKKKNTNPAGQNILLLRKNYDDLIEKNLKLEKNLADTAKNYQGSTKVNQILKRKLEIVTEKYEQMRKQYSKEKYIGLPQTQHKSSEHNSFADLTGLLDSPTKTPRREAKAVNFSLTNLRDRRDLKKATLQENNTEYFPDGVSNFNNVISNSNNNNQKKESNNDVIEELEIMRDKVRTESFNKASGVSSPLIHKKKNSLHITKPNIQSIPQVTALGNVSGFQSARSNFGGNNKEAKSSFSKHNIGDLNNSMEIGSLVLTENNDTLNNELECPQIEWKMKSNIDAHSAAVYAVCSFGNLLYSSSNKCFKVWSLDTLKPISEINAHPSFIKTMILWPEKNVLLTACEKTISVWDVITLKHVTSLKAHKDEIHCLHASNDFLFSAGKGSIASGALFAWDLRSPNFIEEREKSQDIFSLYAHGNVLYYGSRNHQVCRLSLENSLEHLPSFESPHFDAVSSLTVLRNNLISGSRDKNLKLWSLEKSFSNNLHTAYAHQDWINVLERNRQETMFYSGSRDGLVKIWGIQDSKLRSMASLNSHSQSVNSICNLDESYENMIATGSSDKTIKLWKISPPEGISEP